MISGGGDILPTEEGHFTRREIKDGWRLSCQVAVKQDMEIQRVFVNLRLTFFCRTATKYANLNISQKLSVIVLTVGIQDMDKKWCDEV